jgi:hypothetical protein
MSLAALRTALLEAGGALADNLRRSDVATAASEVPADQAPRLAASGPRATADPSEYELLMEMILEGSLLHYGRSRVIEVDDPDLALLLGDQLYALGLSRLAALGDVAAVAELGDLISLVAQAHAAGDAALVDAAWRAGAVAIGWGQTPGLASAKAAARRGERSASAALDAAAAAILAPSEVGAT